MGLNKKKVQSYAYDVPTLKLKNKHYILPIKECCAMFTLLNAYIVIAKKNKNTAYFEI